MAQELKKVLTLHHLIAFAIMTMVPIAPMGIYGIVAIVSHGHVPMCYLFGAIAMSFTAWGYGQFVTRYPHTGSVYAYVRNSIGSHPGFFAGWIIFLDYILIPGLVILVSALWLKAETGVPVWIWTFVFIVPMTFLNIRGVDLMAKVVLILFYFELVVFALFTISAIYVIATTPDLSFNLKPFYNPNEFTWPLIFAGTSIAVLSFLGFDCMTTLAEETIEARKTVQKACLMVIPVVAVLFVSQAYLGAIINPGYTFENPDVAFWTIALKAGGRWLQFLCMAGTVIAWGFGDTLAAQAAVSRILFAMGREKQLPSVFAKLHPKYQTPYVAIYLVGILTLGLVLIMSLQDLSSLVNFGALSAFLLLHVSLAITFIKEGKMLHLIIPAIGFICVAAIWIGLGKLAMIIGFSWLALGLIYLLFITKGFKVKTILPE